MARPHKSLRQQLRLTGLVLVGAVLLAYPLDWMVWRIEVLCGGGMGSAQMLQTTAATLKGDHFEIYQEQTTTVSCSRSVLPEAGAGPCWWLRRHPQSVTQY